MLESIVCEVCVFPKLEFSRFVNINIPIYYSSKYSTELTSTIVTRNLVRLE